MHVLQCVPRIWSLIGSFTNISRLSLSPTHGALARALLRWAGLCSPMAHSGAKTQAHQELRVVNAIKETSSQYLGTTNEGMGSLRKN